MNALNKKLFRDLWRLRGQVLAVALVIGSGVATLVMSLSTISALEITTETYYQRYRFADVFAYAKRVPERLSHQIAAIEGVQSLQTRITTLATLDIQGFNQPTIGQLVSIPAHGQPLLNQIVLRQGRWITQGNSDEVIVSEPFAQAHNLQIGVTLGVIMNGAKRQFSVVGIALSPEFIYSIGPGALLPDDKRFGVLWLSRDILAGAYDLKESFNNVVLSLSLNTPEQPILDKLDGILEPYGGSSAIPRKDQISNWFVMNEIAQQRTMATILPTIFIAVSMFLTNMVLARLIATERAEIGLLKAFGYGSLRIGWHYTKMVLVISIIGIILGSALGTYFGHLNTTMYAQMFRFPLLIYQPGFDSLLMGAGVSITAAILGALSAVRTAVQLPPAAAMAPPSPPIYRHSRLSSQRWFAWLDQPTRIALRQIGRWPLRSALTSLGVAMAIGLIILSMQWSDSLNHLAKVYFFDAQRQDAMVGVYEPVAMRSIHDFAKLPGVLRAEPMRFVSADFKASSITHRGMIKAILPTGELQPIYDDKQGKIVNVPKGGLVIAARLAQKLNVAVGDKIWVEVLEGRRPKIHLPIVHIFEAYIGLPVYMDLDSLNRYLVEPPSFTYANLLLDKSQQPALFSQLKDTPKVSAVMLRESALDSFNQTLIEHLMVFISMFTGLAILLAFGVTYNSTRIALSERGRELATLRVLGFSKSEISYVLLGEVLFLVVLSIPFGCLFGFGLVWSMAQSFDTEMYRVPLVIHQSTYAYAILFVLAAAAVSAALVRRRLDKLDLIRVLKTRE
ncbi:FtsX-like permease family protein [Aliiglaciecola sp. LCG003]|uniref:ABC transporter permease n=1 Tax=Aliiglaciecola sp. LCG003 TaxID=3053655 RepID=UPI00257247F8|nr:FtsX-like permease family protein [Aliiglaciecola sp. LCG003]WJG10785.1 FtsX-like permease family protein [Aliiglaciecola sp. LCG003]